MSVGRLMMSLSDRLFALSMPWQKQKTLIGIELGVSAVRLVALQKYRKKFHVVACGTQAFASDGDEVDWAVVQSALANLLSRCGIQRGSVAMVLSAPVMMRQISLPSGLSDDEIDIHIRLDAQKYIAYPLEEMNFDFWRLGDDGVELSVLLVVVREQAVHEAVAMASACGLEVLVVEVQEFALARALADELAGLSGGVLVVHIDQTKTHLYGVAMNQHGVFAGFDDHQEHLTMATAYEQVDDELNKAVVAAPADSPSDVADSHNHLESGMNFEEFLQSLEQNKESVADTKEASVSSDTTNDPTDDYAICFDDEVSGQQQGSLLNMSHTHHSPIIDDVGAVAQADRIAKLIAAYEISIKQPVDMVILSGMADDNLVNLLAQSSHKMVKLANPFAGMSVARGVKVQGECSGLSVACGAAMRADDGGV